MIKNVIVTGGAGFIGSRLVKRLNEIGIDDIIIVDSLKQGEKFKNLLDLNFIELVNPNDVGSLLKSLDKVGLVLHQGAISSTEEWNGDLLIHANYESSLFWLNFCFRREVPLIYASSASVYGATKNFSEDQKFLKPLNPYGFSKLLFDKQVQKILNSYNGQVVGLRYFNVYGPCEFHKGNQASPFCRFLKSIRNNEPIVLFYGDDGHNGNARNHRRDFIHVSDVLNVIQFFIENRDKSGIFNVGSGRTSTFKDVFETVRSNFTKDIELTWKMFPEHLKGKTQPYTCADLTKLRKVGYNKEFKTIKEGSKYV